MAFVCALSSGCPRESSAQQFYGRIRVKKVGVRFSGRCRRRGRGRRTLNVGLG